MGSSQSKDAPPNPLYDPYASPHAANATALPIAYDRSESSAPPHRPGVSYYHPQPLSSNIDCDVYPCCGAVAQSGLDRELFQRGCTPKPSLIERLFKNENL